MMIYNTRMVGSLKFAETLCVVLAIVIGVSGCSSPKKRWESPVLITPNQTTQTGMNQQSIDSRIPGIDTSTTGNQPTQEIISPREETPIAEPVPLQPAFENGWIVNSDKGLSLDDLARKAEECGVTQIQLGGEVVQAVDDLILNEGKRRFVQQVAERMEAKNIKVFVCSREIHLEGKTFLFNPDDPMIAARQSAYRKALRFIPQLDGVVLTFTGAQLPPWEAVIPEGRPSISVPERIRFLIDMIRQVVVDELGKWLYVRLEEGTPEQTEWIAQALSGYSNEPWVAILPDSVNQSTDLGSNSLWLNRFAHIPKIIQLDLAGTEFGGPRFIVNCLDQWNQWQAIRQVGNFRGTVTTVYGRSGSLLNSPNEINLLAFSQSSQYIQPDIQAIESDWIQKRYNILPMTREEYLLSTILENSILWNRKMALIKDTVMFADQGDLPSPERWNINSNIVQPANTRPESAFVYRQLTSPDKQTLVDLEQESAESIDLLEQANWDIDSIRMQLNTEDYNDLKQRIEHQRLMADVFLYAKQAIWGYSYWKQTRDEDEALHLEAHLQKLEQQANLLEQRFGPMVVPGNPDRIRAWVKRIRSDFPRVVLGWREREWNRLKGILIRQTGPSGVEIKWTSAKPSTSRLFITTNLPVFEKMMNGSTFPVTDHRISINDLEMGKKYVIKIQCVEENGDVTNSGNFSFELESAPMM